LQVADTIWLMTRSNGIQIGTPQELAQSGALSEFIERSQDITFEKETLSVRVGR
jgi:iron complex transport system ATP-binding protein